MIKAKLAGDREMLVLRDDEGISEELLLKGFHEPRCTTFMRDIVLKPGMSVIEIGANIGYYALIEAEVVDKVYAIEPVPANIECLKANIKKYNITNLFPFQFAIGAENGTKTMRIARFSNSGTLIRDDDEEVSIHYKNWFNGWYAGDIIVEQLTLDHFCELNVTEAPDLIRMDVEGYEVEVIYGAQRILASMPVGSHLFIELHPVVFEDRVAIMYGLLENLYSHGFRPVWCEGESEFPKELQEFTDYACREEAHCPHVFFEKF